ncbi:MAG: DMT family transporter [Clostridiales bacterium]|nr:DMT family transporter [Clostridiales bacterium]
MENADNLRKLRIRGNMMIICATLIWGAGMAAQSAGMTYVSPLTFNAARFFIGGTMALGPALYFLRRQRAAPPSEGPAPISKRTILAGIICGLVLCVAINLQQFGIVFTTVANAAFITSLYVIIVPIVCLFIFRQRVPVFVWIGVAVAMTGMYFLSFAGGFNLNLGDLLVFLCAIGFSAQILVISHFSPKHNVLALACVQFYTVFAVSLIFAFIFETPSLADLAAAAPFVLYTGVLSSGVAYILQMKAQKTTQPTVAAVLFSFESVVATITGWVVLGQFLTPRQMLGCALIFVAILVAQIPAKAKKAAKA